MKLSNLNIFVGKASMPKAVLDRIRLVAFADANHVLGQMAYCLPEQPSGGFADVCDNAKLRAAHDHTMLTFELDRLERALEGSDIRAVILKGGAYVARDMKAAQGRRVSDLDILVAKEEIEAVEKLLSDAGWMPDEQTDNEYDQQYYRKHMHELPPLRHRSRGTVIDVHHALLPPTARHKIDSKRMFEEAVKLELQNLWTLTPVDIFIHSAVHAFSDGAVDAPVRTLVEHYLLFGDLSPEDRSELKARAIEVGSTAPVAMALWFIGEIFQNEEAMELSRQLRASWRHFLTKRAVMSKASDGLLSPFGKAYLYIRSHYLRMPLYLLIPHLTRKALRWRPGQEQPMELPKP